MPKWRPQSISEVVDEIHDSKYVLPVIQRSLVWKDDQMAELFDSVMKGNAFGGIMVLREKKDTRPFFETRRFSIDGSETKSLPITGPLNSDRSCVIDGQQRLQAFYMGLKGYRNGKMLCFDLLSSRQEYDFQFAENPDDLPKTVREDTTRSTYWYPVSELYQRIDCSSDDIEEVVKAVAKEKCFSNHDGAVIGGNIRRFHDAFFTEECVGVCTVEVGRETDDRLRRERIVELFKRLNQGGTSLDAYDLIAAKLKSYNYQMETFLKGFRKYERLGFDEDDIIRLLFVLQDDAKRNFADILERDAEFAITNKDRIAGCIESVCNFLTAFRLENYYSEGRRSTIPLYFIAYHVFHHENTPEGAREYFSKHDTQSENSINIYRWMHYSLLNGVFRSRGAGWVASRTGVSLILDRLSKTKGKPFPTDNLFKLYREYPLVFKEGGFTDQDLDKLDMDFVLYLIYDKRRQIRQNDIDHIHPKSRLEKRIESLHLQYSDIHTIRNYQRLDFSTNRGDKNALPFKEWLDGLGDAEAKQRFINEHLIPSSENEIDLLDENNYRRFLAERSSLILAKLCHQCWI